MPKTPEYMRRRDGSIVSFNSDRISSAIARAGAASGEFVANIAKVLTDKVIAALGMEPIQDIEHIQDVVERVLWEEGYNHTARAYIVYREQHARLRTERKIHIDVISSIEEYLNRADWRVNANANQGYSLGGLILNSAGKMIANYWLSHVYPPEIGDAHRNADLHIHDLDFLAGYCAGWSLRMLLQEGLNGVPGKVEAAPPKHMSSAIGQIVNFLGTLQNEWAGAQAFSSFDTYMAPYVRVDKLNYSQVKQNIQELIYNLNVPSRWGNQTVFSNLTFDWVCPEDLRPQIPLIGGKEADFTYGDLQHEMDLINQAYIEVMTEGDDKGRIFTFPIPTYNITNDFPWDSENANLLFNMTAKYGLPYFCLEENTLIFTQYGTKPIKDVNLNDHVIGSDGQYKQIKHIIKTLHNSVISISTTSGREVLCSDSHRFPIATGIKQALDINLGDTLIIDECALEFENGMFLNRFTEHYFNIFDEHNHPVVLKELNACPIFCRLIPKPRTIRHLTPFNFYKTRFQTTIKDEVKIPLDLNEDICELLGQLIGDGSLRKGRISLANADKEVIQFFCDVIHNEFNLETSISQCGVSQCCKTITTASVILTTYLEHIGLDLTTCYYKSVPLILYDRSDKEIAAFLRGLFDTDGTVGNRRSNPLIALTSVSNQLLLQVIDLLALLSIVAHYNEKSHTITITGIRNVRLFSEKIGFRIQRKQEKIRITAETSRPSCGSYIIEQATTLDGTYSPHYRYKKEKYFRVNQSSDDTFYLFCKNLKKGHAPDSILKIERIVKPTVMVDLEISSDDHIFLLANGILTHNSNFVSSDMDPHMIRSMCCRLRLDLSELLKRGNGLFGSSEQTGSAGVVTINCARLGYLFKNDITNLYTRLDYLLELAKNSLEIKRKVIQRHIDLGLFPYTKRYLGTLRNHFSTIGVNGINEMIRNFTQDVEDITTPNGHEIAARLLDHIRAKMIEFQEATGHMYNLEATPAEGTTYRFAKEDQKRFNEILQAGTKDAPYYTNSSQLPVGYTTDAFQALEMQEDLQAKYTGGCVEKGTKVITDKGSFSIEEIVDNFESLSPIHTLSYNINNEQSEWDLITDAMRVNVSQHDKIRVIAEKGLNIVTSDWHPFFVLQEKSFAGVCPVCEMKLASAKGLPSHFRTHQECKSAYLNRQQYEVIEKRADQLLAGDYILQNATNMFAANIGIDDDLAYLLGFFISNGSISKTIDNRGENALEGFSVRFFSEHQRVLIKVAEILNKHFDCCVSPRRGDKRTNKLLIVSTSKKSVCDFLFSYDFHSDVKAYTVRIPIKLQQCLSESSFYALLSGLIDGDGHINKRNGDIEYNTVSNQLAADIVALCAVAGIAVGMYEHPARRPNEVVGYRVLFSSGVATRMKDKLSIQNDNDYIKDNLSNRNKRLFPVIRVLSTNKISVEDNLFYDLTTKHNHNYLAGNNSFVFIHNTVLHLYMGERISNAEACKKLIKRALERFRVPYLTISPTFSICPVHGYINGEHKFCPICDEMPVAKEFKNAC